MPGRSNATTDQG